MGLRGASEADIGGIRCMNKNNMQLRQEETLSGGATDGCYHLGNILMDFFNKPEDHLWQIDAGTGEAEMKSSVKSRSIQLARSLRNAGLKPGDVVTVSGVNHLDVHIPFYAAYMNGLPLSGIDPFYKYEEIKVILQTTRPKVVFCELFNLDDYERVVRDLGLEAIIVTFGDKNRETSYANFVKKYDDNAPESEFRVVTFDTNKVYAWLISTSGTTGLPKVAAFKHLDILKIIKIASIIKQDVQWISAYLATVCMIIANHIKVQTSSAYTVEHAIDIINKYKPVVGTSSPLLFNNIMKHKKQCDLTCFKKIVISGFSMNAASLQELKARMRPDGSVWNLFAQTECVGSVLMPAPHGPLGNCGTELPVIPVKLVDPTTGEVITEANRTGELWTKGPRFTEYYNNPEATAAAFSPDGWFKTGDLMYKDENGFYFYVERMSSSFRFRNYYVMPLELEMVIQEHPEVADVCVVGVPHPEDGKQAVACVQRYPGSTLTEQKVKDIVADKLSFHKHLHGGVILVDDFPRTISGKIARAKVRDFVLKLRGTQASEYPCSGNTKKLISTFQQLSSTNNGRYVSTGKH